jgi:glycosyltransferase involved in cell wall biosynthesis
MSPRPLVSVIMSVFNERAEYLDLAVNSILAQTYAPLEFLIMDDGSDPETAAALAAAARRDPRIRLSRQANAGLTVALNRLIRKAKGAYVARQDSDDLSEPQRLARQVAFLESHPEVMLLGTGALLIDSQGGVLHHQRVEARPALLKRRLHRTNQFVHGSVIFRAGIFNQEFAYHEGCRYCQDYDLFLRIAEHHPVANLDLPLYRYRINPQSISMAKVRQQTLMGMVVREAGRRRRQGRECGGFRETYAEITASLNTPRHQRRLAGLVLTTQARNLLLLGKKAEAQGLFWRALAACPSPARLRHLLLSLLPGRVCR